MPHRSSIFQEAIDLVESLSVEERIALIETIDRQVKETPLSRTEIPVWSVEEQQQRNRSAMRKLQEAIDRNQKQPHSPEAQRFFEAFQQLVDSDRPIGQKLFSE